MVRCELKEHTYIDVDYLALPDMVIHRETKSNNRPHALYEFPNNITLCGKNTI